MAKALYRKYRPCRMEDVVGQEQVTVPLANALRTKKIAHAYLFTGPRGCGKTSVARIFAHAVNDFHYELEDDYLDIIEIDAASNTGVDNIRDLREKATIVPTRGKYKVYIIDEVHMLSKSAFNALLKTLEEPPAHVIFIMATTDPQKVPITITSRTQVFEFKLVGADKMVEHLRQVALAEKIPITDEALGIIARRGGGSFRDSLSLLDQIATLSEQKIEAAMVEQAFGLPSERIVAELLAAYPAGDLSAATKLLKDYYSIGGKAEILAAELIARIVADPEPAFYHLLEQLPTVRDPFAEAKLLLCFMPEPAAAPKAKVGAPAVAAGGAPARVAKIAGGAPAQQGPAAVEPAAKSVKSDAPAVPAAAAVSTSAATGLVPAEEGVFEWEDFLEAVDQDSARLKILLTQSRYDFKDNTLTIFPGNGLAKKTFAKPESRQVLIKHLSGITLIIADGAKSQSPAKQDPTISQISDIMGNVQEVTNDIGSVPF